MMKKIILVIFVLMLSINISYGEVFNDEFIHIGSGTNTYLTPGAGSPTSTYYYINSIQFNDVETMSEIDYLQFRITNGWFYNPGGKEFDYCNVDLYIAGNKVGTGIYGFNKGATYTYIQLWLYDFDASGYSGNQIVSLSGNTISLSTTFGGQFIYTPSMTSGNDIVFFRTSNGRYPFDNNRQYFTSFAYTHTFPFIYTNVDEIYSMNMERDSVNTSKITVTISGNEIINETSLQTNDFMYVNLSSPIWDVTNENIFGDIITKTLIFSEIPSTTAEISLNQTSYTFPEIIKTDITLTDADYTNYYYRIKTQYSYLVGVYDYASVIYNQSQLITTDDSTFEITLNEEYYDLPILLKVIVEGYNKNTGEATVIGESNEILYSPTMFYDNVVDGYILSTQDNSYLTGVYIAYNDGNTIYSDVTDNSGYFKLYLPTNMYDISITNIGYHDVGYDEFIDSSRTEKHYLTPLNVNVNLYGNILNTLTNFPVSNVKVIVSNSTYEAFTTSNSYGYFEFLNIEHNKNYTIRTDTEDYYNYNQVILTNTSQPTYVLIEITEITYDNDIDEDIDSQITHLKEEIKPLKDLIFGLSEIVIDNPDYDNDNIVTQEEYSSWINSFISIVIVIFIIIMFIGLKDRRGKR